MQELWQLIYVPQEVCQQSKSLLLSDTSQADYFSDRKP